MVKASIEAGIPASPDFNGSAGGCRLLPDDDDQPPALELARAYLGPARVRQKFDGGDNAHATRILFGGGRLPSVSNHTRGPRQHGREAGSSFPAGSTAHRNCCSFRARPGRSVDRSSVFQWSATCPGSGRISTTISTPVWRCPQRSRSTTWHRHARSSSRRRCNTRSNVQVTSLMPGSMRRPGPTDRGSKPDLPINMSAGTPSSDCAPGSSRIRSRPLPSARCICAPMAVARYIKSPIRWPRRRSG